MQIWHLQCMVLPISFALAMPSMQMVLVAPYEELVQRFTKGGILVVGWGLEHVLAQAACTPRGGLWCVALWVCAGGWPCVATWCGASGGCVVPPPRFATLKWGFWRGWL